MKAWTLVLAFVAGCGGASTVARPDTPSDVSGVWLEDGLASWYGARFAGKPTASREPFDPNALTAAHRKLRLGTWIEVMRVETGARVVVRVNDRGPYHGDRILDLSRAAAERLGMLREGVVRVKLRVVR